MGRRYRQFGNFEIKERETIRYKLPQDAINPAHGSILRLNSPSSGIFSQMRARNSGWQVMAYEKETEEEPSHASTNLVSLRNLGLLRELTLGPKFQDNKIVSLSSSS